MFEWDDTKSDATLQKRGFDFAFAVQIFEGATLENEDDRTDYGETRIRAVGIAEGHLIFLVYTWRGDTRRIISARLASRKERDAYRQAYG